MLDLTMAQNVLRKPVSVTANSTDVIRNPQPTPADQRHRGQERRAYPDISLLADAVCPGTRDQGQWVLAGAVTEELLWEQDVVSQVDLWRSRLSVVATKPWLY